MPDHPQNRATDVSPVARLANSNGWRLSTGIAAIGVFIASITVVVQAISSYRELSERDAVMIVQIAGLKEQRAEDKRQVSEVINDLKDEFRRFRETADAILRDPRARADPFTGSDGERLKLLLEQHIQQHLYDDRGLQGP